MFYLKSVTALNTNRTASLATGRRLIFPIWNQVESNLDSSEQRMRKLICPSMFCNLHDASHFLRINTFVMDG